ncbi:MAG: hypothetical protein PHF21_01580 [Bacilli bacterium]|nr:hypothetical protein [Bacilli bacterium]
MKVIKKIIFGILAVTYFLFVIINTILMLNINKYGSTQFDDKTFVVIRSEISSDKYLKGDLVITKKPKLSEIEIGDEIFVYKIKRDGSPVIDLGIIGDLHPDNDAISFENGASYQMDLVLGKTEKIYNNIGHYYGLVQSQWGFLFVILIPSFLLFIYELYAIIVEIKYGKPEANKK